MSKRTHSILVVDDDTTILKVLTALVSRASYEVESATSADDALVRVRERRFAVVISDQHMPGMPGSEFLREVASLQPNASRILITGLRSLDVVASAVNIGGIFRLLTKPWSTTEFFSMLEDAVQRYERLESAQELEQTTRELNHRLSKANDQLALHVRELQLQKQELDASREALQANFQRSLDLCQRMLSTFNPLLGEQAKSAVRICEALAVPPRFTEAERRTLIVSAHLYDIGLTGIPREYTRAVQTESPNLPNKIQHLVRNHTIHGQALASFAADLECVGQTIRSHHERFDGAGYPDGLAGEMIPWTARCLAVVAYYTSSGMKHELAIERILELSGSAFDPDAVRLFLRCSEAKPPPNQVREVLLEELRSGMQLATGIYSPMGMLLIPEGHLLDDAMISKLRNHSDLTSLPQQLLVYC